MVTWSHLPFAVCRKRDAKSPYFCANFYAKVTQRRISQTSKFAKKKKMLFGEIGRSIAMG